MWSEICQYNGKKQHVSPLELPGFLLKLLRKYDLIFIQVKNRGKHNVHKVMIQTIIIFPVFIELTH